MNSKQEIQQAFDDYNRIDSTTIIDEIIDYNYSPDGTLDTQTDAKNLIRLGFRIAYCVLRIQRAFTEYGIRNTLSG